MRLCLLTLLASSALAAAPFPDEPGVADLKEFRRECERSGAEILQLERTDKSTEATKLHAALWERYDAEVFARRAQAADLSLAAVNPMLTAAERAVADEKLSHAAMELTELADFAMPDPATRDQFLARLGKEVTEIAHARAQAHFLLQTIRNSLAVARLFNRPLADRRGEVVARLERLAAASQPLAEAITDARDLPIAKPTVSSLIENLEQPDAIEHLFELTSNSLALEATLTELILSDPANHFYWLARARGRFALGWRSAAVVDLTIATHFKAEDPAVVALNDRLRAVSPKVSSLWQETVDSEAAQAVMAARRIREMADEPPEQLSVELERTARAALRNRARRLYACSFIAKPETRLAALRFTDEQNPLVRGLFPVLSQELVQQYEAEIEAAGTDARTVFAAHHRYASLFATTEGFWEGHVSLLLAASQPAGARAALAVAENQFEEQTPWIQRVKSQLNEAETPPDSGK